MPDLTPAPPTILLRIKRYDFSLTRRYHTGQRINDSEAYALNQMFAENIRNNTIHWISKAEAQAPKGLLSTEQLAELQTKISEYASKYQFQVRHRTRSMSPIDVALEELALAQATAEGRQHGLGPSDPAVKLRYRQLLADPSLQLKARELVNERERVAQDTLSDLMEGYAV